MSIAKTALMCGVLLVLAACPAPSPESDLSGNWEGTIEAFYPGFTVTGDISLSVIQQGNSVAGTWTDYFSQVGPNGGNFTGHRYGSSVSLMFFPSDPSSSCSFQAVGKVSDDTIAGTYAAIACTQSQSGTFVIQRVEKTDQQ